MNERDYRINDFLNYLATVQKQNPSISLPENMIYRELVRLGVPDKEKNYSVDSLFTAFVQNFESDTNQRVFVDPNWSYFCQFIQDEPNRPMVNEQNHIKLYVPLDEKHMYVGVDKIFNFLSEQKIPHISKVGSNIRNDDVVLRLVNPEDARKVIDYIGKDQYLQNGLLPANPFLHQENGIAMTCDGNLSFSTSLAFMLTEYIHQKKQMNALDYVNANDFYTFTDYLYQYLFVEKKADFAEIQRLFPRVQNSKNVADLKIVFDVLKESRRPDFTFDDYIQIYEKGRKPNEVLASIHQFDDVPLTERVEPTEQLKDAQVEKEKMERLLEKGIDIISQRVGSRDVAIYTMREFLNRGDYSLITRTGDLRDTYIQEHFHSRLQIYLGENQIQLDDMLTEIDAKKEKKDIPNAASKMRLVMDVMGSKYGEKVALDTVAAYLQTGNVNHLTKEYGIRKSIGESNLRKQINRYLQSQNLSAEEFLSDISANRTPEQYFEDACAITYNKYQTLYENGESEINGQQWLNYAIGSYVQSGEANGFTRDFNARFHIQSHVTPENAKQAIAQKLGANVSDLNPSYGSLVTLCKEYTKAIADESFIRN